MKLKKDYILQDMGEDAVLVPVGTAGESFHGIVRLNNTAAFVVARLRQGTDFESICDAMCEEYDADREVLERSVTEVIRKLRDISAIED